MPKNQMFKIYTITSINIFTNLINRVNIMFLINVE